MARLVRFRGSVLILVSVLAVGCSPTADTKPTSTTTTTPDDEADVTDNTVDPTSDIDRSSQVLRHAVFFSFKESSSAADVMGVVDAFRALPSKIDAIIDFQWGTNNSPEGKDDGFTHCFLLTFKDEAGRATYLPHDEHKAFGDVLRPHMKDVFVIDYWGTPYPPLEKELKHAVFFKFKDDADAAAVIAVEESFAALPSQIDAIKTFEWGKNNSPESNDDGFTHCFMVGFDSEAGRLAYLPHPDHEAFVSVLRPVLDKVRVLDFWAEK